MTDQRAKYAGPRPIRQFQALLGLILIGTTAIATEASHGPDWVLVNPKADWQARDSQGEFVFNNHLWILGGWFTPRVPNPRDVWKSPDGKHWTCTVQQAGC